MTNHNTNSNWHIKLYRKSLLKQAKWRQIENLLPAMDNKKGLDIGADNGVISHLLRQPGGSWHSVDATPETVESIRNLVGGNVVLMEDGKLPFADETFDCVVIIDMLEHLDDDYAFIKECHRVLKPAGRLIVNVPHIKKTGLVRLFRKMLGLSDAEHGHVRPGYTQQQLFNIMKDGFGIEKSRTYSRFFVELMDSLIRFVAKKSASPSSETSSKGLVIDEEQFSKMKKLFAFYSILYPFFWIAAQLDHLLFFTKGYYLIASARRRLWIPHKTPKLRDGRSIADAALNTKIGSANPF